MLRRFVAASMVASVAIAIGAFIVLVIPGLGQRTYPLLVLWCFIPCIWGLWAMIAPTHWVPDQLPYWGAGLGFFAALIIVFGAEVPQKILGIPMSMEMQTIAVLGVALFYYLMWSIVKVAYHHLHELHHHEDEAAQRISAGGAHTWRI